MVITVAILVQALLTVDCILPPKMEFEAIIQAHMDRRRSHSFPLPKMECASCGQATYCRPKWSGFVCTACRQATYCSRACQKTDWKFHRRTCGLTVAASDAMHFERADGFWLAFRMCEMPAAWQCPGDAIAPAWALARAHDLRVQVRHLQFQTAIAAPDHPLVRSYVGWQNANPEIQSSHSYHSFVSVKIQSYHSFVDTYGKVAFVNTVRTLKDTGRPLPFCFGHAIVKDLIITIRVLSGAKLEYGYGCKYNDLVSLWTDRAEDWVAELMHIDKDLIFVQLMFQGEVLCAHRTLSENGIDDGAELLAIVNHDYLPALVDSSNNSDADPWYGDTSSDDD